LGWKIGLHNIIEIIAAIPDEKRYGDERLAVMTWELRSKKTMSS
jgi:hypothetical protein